MIDVYVDIDDSFIAAGAWSPNGSYTKGDRVYDNSSQSINNLSPIYVCVNDNSNSVPSSSNTDWILAGTSPEYPLLTKDPMETSIVDTTHSASKPWEYEWSFDGSNISGDPVMRHYRMIEEAGGGRVIFMFETFDSPHTGNGTNTEAMLRLIPGPILSNTTKITFDSYGKNTTIIYSGYGGNPNNAPSYGLSQFDPLDDPRANNYYFNNLTFLSKESFSSLFGGAAGEFTGCKFIKTHYDAGPTIGAPGHRFFTSNNGSSVKAKFVKCLFEQSYGAGIKGNSAGTEFIGCTFVYTRFNSVTSYAISSLNNLIQGTVKTFKDNIFYIKKIQDFNPSQSYSIRSKVMHDGTIYMNTFGAYTSGSSTTPYDSNSDWGIFDTNLSINAIEKSNNIIYIEGYESDSNYVGITYQDPMFVDPGSSDYRLRPSSPLIGGLETSNLNPEGVYIQPGDSTGGSGTFEDPYYMAELGTAETEAAAGNGIIYFVDGYYEINSLNFYEDGITYKSLNKHKAILGNNDSDLVNAKIINIGGGYGATNLDVGNITLEDFYVKNTRFQQVSNSLSRPNKIKGLKIEDTHPIKHATDGFLWNDTNSKLIIESCFIYLNFATENHFYFARTTEACEILNSTLIINFPQTSGHVTFTTFGSIENSIIYATTQIPESGFPALTANSKNCCFYNIGSNATYGGENTYQGDPKFVDPNSRDFRLKADSPLIGGVSKSKYPANSVWIDSTSGTGTGTEDDPFTLSQFNDAIDLAITNETFELIHKDGTYTWTTSGEEIRHPNLGLVTLVAENFQKATITNYPGRLNIGNLTSQTLKMKDMVLFAQDHFIGNQNCHLIFDRCYINSSTYLFPSTNGSYNFKNCIIEKRLSSDKHVISTAPGLFSNCLFIDRNLNSTTRFDDTAFRRTFKNCIFRSEQTSNPNSAIHGNGNLINCVFYNYNSNDYNYEEVIFNGDPLMINFDPVSHENSNYALRPTSPLIGQGK